MSNLIVRSITGALFVLLILGSIFWNDISATAVFCGFLVLGLIEFNKLFTNTTFSKINWELSTILGVIFSGLIVGVIYNTLPFWTLVLLFPLIFIVLLSELWRNSNFPITNGALMLLSLLYVAVPFLLVIYLNHFDGNSFPLIAGMFLLIWSNDTFAYLSGRLLGKTKLFERISPKKTWEGTIGGVFFTLLTAFIIGNFLDSENFSFWIISATIIAPAAVLGDLLESLFKRSLNIKDSGTILPGHGGILDRFDAMLLVAPFFLAWTFIYMYF